MGFRTLAIQQRTTEVWSLLGLVKTEFGKYAGLFKNVKKKLEQASSSIEKVEQKAATFSGSTERRGTAVDGCGIGYCQVGSRYRGRP
jgi:DNA anti-recombination protein RmuC